MTLIVKGMSRDIVEIHNVTRVWFEDGRTWYTKEGYDFRLGYGYSIRAVIS